jgi:hypothetical protein
MTEPAVDDLERRLEKAGRRLVKALSRGDERQLAEAKGLYARLKGELAAETHRVAREAARAAGAQQAASVPVSGRRGLVQWSRGRFGLSPGAYERDRLPPEPEKPQVPYGGHLSPWRRSGSPASEQIYRP